MESTCTVMESQVDWLTATCGNDGDVMAFLRLGEASVTNETVKGNRRSGFGAQGYRGSHSGRASYGCRADGAVMSLSGELASASFDATLAIATHISRIDVQVTAVLDPPILDIESAAFQQALARPPRAGTKPSVELTRYQDGTATLYLGKRISPRFLRIYNKGMESGEVRYRGAHRYEVETKADEATTVAGALRVASARPEWCVGFVYAHCTERGIVPVFQPGGAVHLVPGMRRRTDDDGRLRWIAAAVRPSVASLFARGRGSDLMSALGMTGEDVSRMLADGRMGV